MQFLDIEHVRPFFKRVNEYCSKKNPTSKETEVALRDMLEFLSAPMPAKAVYKYFASPYIIRELRRIIHNEYEPYRKLLDNYVGTPYPRSNYFYRTRALGDYGTYPNDEYSRRGLMFTIYDGKPYIITKNSRGGEDSAGTYYTEVSHITRNEVRLAFTILCGQSSTNGILCLYFEGQTHDVDAGLVEAIPADLRTQFLIEYASLMGRLEKQRSFYLNNVNHLDGASFNFNDETLNKDQLDLVLDAFSINDFLLLRTATYLVKGTMLWRPEPFREESLANIFFALEGCMLLLQRKLGLSYDRVDRKGLPAIFNRLFLQGEGLFDFIDEAIGWGGKRAWIAHPHTDNTFSWIPPLMADDYYEYEEVVRMLLKYILTDDIMPAYRKV